MGLQLEINPIKHWLPQLNNPLIIAGPCSLETEEQTMETARLLAKDPRIFVFRGGVWKPRTRPGSFEGIGSIGLKWLQMVREETGMPVGTEIANAQHAEEALNAGLDVLWIGARSTASPFVVQEIADVVKGSDAVVMVKNPVNPDVQLWVGAFERLSRAGIKNMVAIHRGFTPFRETEYRNYPNWKTVIELRHCALSDKEQQLTPADLALLLDRLIIRTMTTDNKLFENQLELLRNRIDALDRELLETLSSRMEIARQIGQYKKDNNVTALQIGRFAELMEKRVKLGESLNLNGHFVQQLFQHIHEDSVRMQTEIMDKE